MLRNTSDTLATSLLSFGKTLMRVRIPFFVIQKTKNSINNSYKVKNKTLKVLFIIKKSDSDPEKGSSEYLKGVTYP
ncbi:hypothetical protein QIU19_08645 [Capnocytophaga canimorsus]|nr:hypothetical protein [Capnocytophaga canimorsus]WGU67611.1 hypothetical protein QIU19_08645 [Capnocytophaga canimorsus]